MNSQLARFAALGLGAGLCLATTNACRSNFEDECDPGTLGCECLPEDACVTGLSCYEGLCAQVVGTETGEEEGTSDGDSSGDGDGDGDGENLLADPGFETWASGINPLWVDQSGILSEETGMVLAGASSGRFAAEGYGSIYQDIDFSPPISGSTCLEIVASFAYVDGDPDAPALLLEGSYEEGGSFVLGNGGAWTANGNWFEMTSIVLPEGTIAWGRAFFTGPSTPQTWLVDEASLRRIPCP
jgi:hypothetical protein